MNGDGGEARRRLLDVATRLFSFRGYDGVGTQEIVEATSVTKPTLYYHFSNKAGLLDAICRRAYEELMGRLGPWLEYRGDLPVTIECMVEAFLRFASAAPHQMRLLIALMQAPPASEGRRIVDPYREDLELAVHSVFAAAAMQHGNMVGREGAYTASFLGTVFAYCVAVMDGRVEADADLAHRAMHQFSHGIYS
jgi:TetR/AcrR family transcriptional regulator